MTKIGLNFLKEEVIFRKEIIGLSQNQSDQFWFELIEKKEINENIDTSIASLIGQSSPIQLFYRL